MPATVEQHKVDGTFCFVLALLEHDAMSATTTTVPKVLDDLNVSSSFHRILSTVPADSPATTANPKNCTKRANIFTIGT